MPSKSKFWKTALCVYHACVFKTGHYLMKTCQPFMSLHPNGAGSQFGVQIPDPKMDRIRCPPTVGGHPRNTKSWSTTRTLFQIDFQRVAGMSVPSKYVCVYCADTFLYILCVNGANDAGKKKPAKTYGCKCKVYTTITIITQLRNQIQIKNGSEEMAVYTPLPPVTPLIPIKISNTARTLLNILFIEPTKGPSSPRPLKSSLQPFLN